MKKIEAVFLEEKLVEVRNAIFKQGVHRFVVSEIIVHDFGRLLDQAGGRAKPLTANRPTSN